MAGSDDVLDFVPSKEPPLAYPTWPLKVRGGVVEEYVIPDDDKEEVLKELYPFDPVPSLEEEVSTCTKAGDSKSVSFA
ncbi:MAG: hypothetical protein HYX92_18455 [Chloroflexi bacterium]|nr:hypothetical protein [Chloroflexota bacterium]